MHVLLQRRAYQGLRVRESPGVAWPFRRQLSPVGAVSARAHPNRVVQSRTDDTRLGTRSIGPRAKAWRGEGWGCDETRDRCRKVRTLLRRMAPRAMRLSRHAALVP